MILLNRDFGLLIVLRAENLFFGTLKCLVRECMRVRGGKKQMKQ